MTLITYNGRKINMDFTDEQLKHLEATSQPITEKVRTLASAYEHLEYNRSEVKIGLPAAMADDELSVASYVDAIVVARALNEEWEADFGDDDQEKWYLVAEGSGFGFSYSFAYYDYTNTYVGARLSFRSKEIADHAGKYFWPVFQGFFKK